MKTAIYKRHYSSENPENYSWHTVKSQAKQKQRTFTLTRHQFHELWAGKCIYCGEPGPSGIDRIDSTKGYDAGNCVSACWICNRAKNRMPVTDFLRHLKRVAIRQEMREYLEGIT